jgi:hypothetical protein
MRSILGMVYRLLIDLGHLKEVRRRAPWLSPITDPERLLKAHDQYRINRPAFSNIQRIVGSVTGADHEKKCVLSRSILPDLRPRRSFLRLIVRNTGQNPNSRLFRAMSRATQPAIS